MKSANAQHHLQRWLRFLVGGGINTVFTYSIYLVFSLVMAYQLAYFLAYIIGIVFAYWFNAVFVFNVPLSWKVFLTYPVVYFFQYIASAALLGVLVEYFHTNKIVAPLIVTVVMIPVTYVLSKLILEWKNRKNYLPQN